MTKQEFLNKLGKGLSCLPQEDIEERLTFYSEMIDDRMEEGFSEEDAVLEIGDIDEIISQTIADIPITKLVKEKLKPRQKVGIWEIILLALGSPIWLSLFIVALAVIFSIYAVLWSVIITLWAVEVAFLGSALGGFIAGIVFLFNSNSLTGVATLGASFACTGLSIFLFYFCKVSTKGILLLTKRIALGIKNIFAKRRGRNE